ncbi:MAG: hypothetical protein RIF44_20375 [Nitratireductor sp.]
MLLPIRVALIVTIAIFMVGIGMKTASAAAMEFVMAAADKASEKALCTVCDDDGASFSCDLECAGVTAVLTEPAEVSAPLFTAQRADIASTRFLRGGGPPDPHPPRIFC